MKENYNLLEPEVENIHFGFFYFLEEGGFHGKQTTIYIRAGKPHRPNRHAGCGWLEAVFNYRQPPL